jgi:hypothetical protein
MAIGGAIGYYKGGEGGALVGCIIGAGVFNLLSIVRP